MGVRVPRASFDEGESIAWQFQVYKRDSTALTQTDVSSVDLYVYDLGVEGEMTSVLEDSLATADVVFNTFQTGSGWSEDSTGYNFAHTFTDLDEQLEGGHAYLFLYVLNLTGDGSRLPLRAIADIEGVHAW